ncbi:MAG: universal stress protein [Thermodesulfobacteriota bacterium]
MFSNILFATTASPTCDDAAKVAFDLARKYQARLHVFHVPGVPTRGFSPFMVDVRTGEKEEIDENYLSLVKEEMKNTYARQLAEYDQGDLEVVPGVPHTEILRKARREDVDLIVMGAHTRREDVGASRFRSVVGSTMQKVAKSARCPVLIISRPCTTCWWYFSHIIFCTDFSKAAQSAFQFALKAAREIPCKLFLFHAVDIGPNQAGQAPAQTEIEKRIAEARRKMEKLYVSQMTDFDNHEMEIWEGIPYVEILKYVREKQGDLIVMAHHTREVDPEQALMGSTVEQVVLRASCPVASVNHPDKVALA